MNINMLKLQSLSKTLETVTKTLGIWTEEVNRLKLG